MRTVVRTVYIERMEPRDVAPEALDTWRAGLEQRVADLEAQIRPLSADLDRTKVQLDLVNKLIDIQSGAAATPLPPSVPSNGGDILEAIEKIIRDAGKPLHISEICRLFTNTGRAIPGQGTPSNLIAYITRGPSRFVRIAKGTYGLPGMASPMVRKRRRRRRRRG